MYDQPYEGYKTTTTSMTRKAAQITVAITVATNDHLPREASRISKEARGYT